MDRQHDSDKPAVSPVADTVAVVLTAADLEIIEAEHARLEIFLLDLRETCRWFETTDTCQGCERERRAACLGRLSSFEFDFVELMEAHMANEEYLMLAALSEAAQEDYLFQHRQAHRQLGAEVRQLLQACAAMGGRGEIAAAIRLLHDKIHALFLAHARQFDKVLLAQAPTGAESKPP